MGVGVTRRRTHQTYYSGDADRIDTSTPYRPAQLALWTAPDARARILQLLAETSYNAPLEVSAGARP